MRRRLLAMAGLVLVLGLSVTAAGCGGGSDSSGSEETTAPADTGAAPADTGAAAGGGEASGEPLTLKIGFSAALSGPYAAYDVPLLNGMEFAAQEINASGGNVTVEIVSKDNKGDQTQTLTAAQELLDEDVKVQILTTAEPSVAVGQLVSAAGGITTVGGNTAPSIPRDIGETVRLVRLRRQSAGLRRCPVRLRSGLQDRVPARLAGDPLYEGHPDVLRGRVRGDLRRGDRRRGHVQDRADRVRRPGDEDPERRPGAGRHLLADLRARLGRVSEAAPVGRRHHALRLDRRQRLVAVRRLGRQCRRRNRLLDPRLRLAGQSDRGVRPGLHGVEGLSPGVEHVRGDRA